MSDQVVLTALALARQDTWTTHGYVVLSLDHESAEFWRSRYIYHIVS